ncbi:MAG: hypothetical protein JEZ06_19840 [Anaerolineaceae bacterium]|nr:hypothetical protein [Anaerolineaceae bacterium]
MQQYHIRIKGKLKESWQSYFGDRILMMTPDPQKPGHTRILVAVPDQATLRGIMNQLWDLNLSVEAFRNDNGE